MLFKYYVSNITGTVIGTDFQNPLTVTIKAKKISESASEIKQFLTDNFLKAESISLQEITFEGENE